MRDITTCLAAVGSKLYHRGIRQTVAHSTLGDANEKRDWRIVADLAHVRIEQVAALNADERASAKESAPQDHRCAWPNPSLHENQNRK